MDPGSVSGTVPRMGQIGVRPAMKIRVSVNTPHPLKIFCLTWRGHIYLPLISKELLLLDRNVLSKVSAPDKISDKAEQYWVGEFNRVSQNINPILTAYEGCFRRRPTRAEFQQELSKSYEKLRQLYPAKQVIEHSTETSGQLYDALEPKLDRQEQEVKFLLAAAPLVLHRPSDMDLMPKIREISRIADDFGLRGRSLVQVALISCISESKHGEKLSAGRRIIKPKSAFSHGDAHNAVADIHYLEFLLAAASGPFGPIVLCTMDQGLAHFWLGLNASHSVKNEKNDISYRFSMDKKLCPRLNCEQLDETRALV